MTLAAPDLDTWVDRLLPAQAAPDAAVEVHLLWGDVVVATRRAPVGVPVTLGAATGWCWRLGGVAVGWVRPTAARWLRLAPPGLSTVEEAPCVDFPVDLGVAEATLVDADRGRPRALVRAGWTVDGWRDGVRLDADGLVAAGLARREDDGVIVDLTPDLRLAIGVAGLVFVVGRATPGARAAPTPPAPDRPLRGAALAALLLALVIGGRAALTPPRTPLTPDQAMAGVPVVREVVLDLWQAPPPPPQRVAVDDRGAAGGTPTPSPRSARPGKGPGKTDRDAGAAAADALFGDVGAALDGPVSALTGGIRGLVGRRTGGPGLGSPGGGLGGPRGGGDGGGADGIGTFPGGDGRPRGGPVGFGPRPPGEPRGLRHDVEAIVLGSLDASAIDEVVRRHLAQIRYCYQRRLQGTPDLEGKLVVRFTIAADGSVSTAGLREDTIDDGEVDACVLRQVRGLRFPEPRGGGVVMVSYPFVFAKA